MHSVNRTINCSQIITSCVSETPCLYVGLQNKTMQMMYETIYKALEEVGLENSCSPEDYLNFYCLGNREAGKVEGNESPSAANTPQVLAYYPK